jgi:micrococcal nuclease
VGMPPNVAHADHNAAAVASAQAEAQGVWGAGCETAPPPPPAAAPSSGRPCDPYPTLCLPPRAADLDCSDIAERRFPVVPPDLHRLDRPDHDGVGCELR